MKAAATWNLSRALAFAFASLGLAATGIFVHAAPAAAAVCPSTSTPGTAVYWRDLNCEGCSVTQKFGECFCRYPYEDAQGLCRGETTKYSDVCLNSSASYNNSTLDSLDKDSALQNQCDQKCQSAGLVPVRSLGDFDTDGGLILSAQDVTYCNFQKSEGCYNPQKNKAGEISCFKSLTNPAINYVKTCFCQLKDNPKKTWSAACQKQTYFLKWTSYADSCNFYCETAGYNDGYATDTVIGDNSSAYCSIDTSSNTCYSATNGSSACKYCGCKYKKDHPTQACQGLTTVAGAYGTVNGPSPETWCQDRCKAIGADYDAVYDSLDKVCNFQAATGCTAPFNPDSSACKGLASSITESQKVLGSGTVLGQLLPRGDTSLPVLIGKLINQVVGIVGALALAFFVWGGLRWMLARGNPEEVGKAKKTITAAIIGLFAIFASYAILNFIIQAFSK